MLEIITGQSPIISGSQGGHLAEWVRQRLSRGNIDTIVDPRIHGLYDVNSVWKVIDLACKCTEQTSVQRPTMNVVVTELRESLDLEIATEETGSESTTHTYSSSQNNYSRNNNYISDVSDNSIPEMAYLGQMAPAPRPAAR